MIAAEPLPQGIAWTLAGLFAALVCGSVVRLAAVRKIAAETRGERLASLRTWWILAVILAAAIYLGTAGVCVVVAVASLLAFREYVRCIEPTRADRHAVRLAFATIPIYYAIVLTGWEQGHVAGPLCVLLGIAVARLTAGETDGYIRGTAGIFWGYMVLVVALSYVARLMTIDGGGDAHSNSAGWLLFVVLLTEGNDIAQALVGRRFGSHKRHRITPEISPNKTWEGFFGGAIVTVALAVALAPVLTPWGAFPGHAEGGRGWSTPGWEAPLAGLLIAISGFLGDINMSAVKRDAGIKDSGTLLPGMGGMMDRVDSLSFTAPSFYFFLMATTHG